MSERSRTGALGAAAMIVAAVFVWTFHLLPPFGVYRGPYGDLIAARVVEERHTPQSIAAVVFDYRGFDTLIEEFIFFSAVAAVLLLLRVKKGERQKPLRQVTSDGEISPVNPLIRLVGFLLFPTTLVAGVSMMLHGHLTPGGGFQGGALTASAFLFGYLSCEYEDFHRLTPPRLLETIENLAAGMFAVVALVGTVAGSLMANFLPLGQTGNLLSAGTIPLLNMVVGVEITTGFLLVLDCFLRQALMIRRE